MATTRTRPPSSEGQRTQAYQIAKRMPSPNPKGGQFLSNPSRFQPSRSVFESHRELHGLLIDLTGRFAPHATRPGRLGGQRSRAGEDGHGEHLKEDVAQASVPRAFLNGRELQGRSSLWVSGRSAAAISTPTAWEAASRAASNQLQASPQARRLPAAPPSSERTSSRAGRHPAPAPFDLHPARSGCSSTRRVRMPIPITTIPARKIGPAILNANRAPEKGPALRQAGRTQSPGKAHQWQ